ncbi:cysteine--tRNA ligase [bacterium]|nr:cysteine--tRNA ligase [bacterium]
MPIFIHNTLTDRKEEFVPQQEGKVRIYSCGLTVQSYAHIGHIRGAVLFDVIRRFLRKEGYEVIYVQNFTDIDDKIIARANKEGVSPRRLAEYFITAYLEDESAMGIAPADFNPRATEHIKEIIEVVDALIRKGYAYVVDGDVYFSVEKFPEYGKLSKRSVEEMLAGARVEVDERKRAPQDFALWKSAKEGEPFWESPWGRGRPGWHIECSVMSIKYLGVPLDIHAGGQDLIFPHHENEIAQSEAFTGQPFARYWIHWAPVNLRGEKMAKSTGNVFIVREALRLFSPQALRLYLLSSHYRSPVDFDVEKVKETERALERAREVEDKLEIALKGEANYREVEVEDIDLEAYRREFYSALEDDFNTPKAIATYFSLLKEAGRIVDSFLPNPPVCLLLNLVRIKSLLREFKQVLGIEEKAKREGGNVEELIDLLVRVRDKLRKQKLFQLADEIRSELGRLGVILEDHPEGTIWRFEGE